MTRTILPSQEASHSAIRVSFVRRLTRLFPPARIGMLLRLRVSDVCLEIPSVFLYDPPQPRRRLRFVTGYFSFCHHQEGDPRDTAHVGRKIAFPFPAPHGTGRRACSRPE